MKEQIFRLCKRLKNCTLNDLVQMLEIDEAIIETALLFLEQEESISIKDGVITTLNIKPKKDIEKKSLYLMAQHISSEEFDFILKGFCLSIPPHKMCHFVSVGSGCICDYYGVFRRLIYEKQFKELMQNFMNKPQQGRYRKFYTSIIRMRRRFAKYGINGLLAKYGTNSTKSSVQDEFYDYFKNLYLKQGGPSIRSCWENTLGYALRTTDILSVDFPSQKAFIRRLQKEIPEQSIYLARKGEAAWNRKYGGYIERDYSTITCGKVWVSDHAQIDVACLTPDGDIVFPWVTAWRDYKSGKWLGWILQCGHPNSDLIFQSFYYAAESFGLPLDVIIDNGKDYRSKDFAGGRKKVTVESDKPKTTSMLAELNVEVHFALPYNAQTKPIERDFLKIKELLSKHCVGYRGGNIVERPEKLAREIKEGKILPFDKFKIIFDDFIINVLNKRPSQGKNHNGLSPDALFNQEFNEKITTSKDALKLFCMRTSKNFTIGRNGIKDGQFGITYWADWMISKTGLKVYLRRDPANYKEAWAFKADNDEFLGTVSAVRAVAALHAEMVSKEEFKEAMSIKKRNLKVAKAYIKQTQEISIEEQCENYKTAFASIEKETSKPKISKLARGTMFFEVARILKDKTPKYFILENVKGLLSHNGGKTFQRILEILSDIGYSVQWQLLNSKFFGVPQNRERVYIVGCYGKECIGKIFPLGGINEENSSENSLIQLEETKGKSQGARVYNPNGISSTLTANSGGLGGKTGLYFINQYYFNCKKSDLSSTLKVGGDVPMVNIPNDSIESFINKPRHDQYKPSDIVQTLKVAGDTPLMRVKNGTKKGYDIAGPGDGISLAYPHSKLRRGRVGKGCSQTLDTSCNMGTIDNFRIRRLTPLECFRLQGFPDEMVEVARKIKLSDVRLYKMAGNATTVNVAEAVARKIAEVENAKS